MKIIFLKPPVEKGNKNIIRDFVYGCWCNGRRIGGMQMPPLNELYAATHTRQTGVENILLDAQIQSKLYGNLLKNKFKEVLAIIVMTSTQSFKYDLQTFKKIKALNSNIKIIIFGSHPTFMPQYCLQEKIIDFIVLREPEETLSCLLKAIQKNNATDDILGIGYRTNSGKIKINPVRPFMQMDDLPIPDRSFLPKGVDYFNPVVKKVPYTTMQTSRGCLGQCIFCTVPNFYGNKIRIRSAKKVLEELRKIKSLGYREVFFRDETFTAFKKRNIEICKSMINEALNLSWIANARIDMIDKETMKYMKRAGCHLLKFGIETGNDEILHNYKKGTTCKQAEAVFQMAHEVGIDTHAHIVFGGPGETAETIKKTISFVKKIKPSTASFGILTPYPGTELFNMVTIKHPEIKDGSDSNMENLHVDGFFSESICGMTGKQLSFNIVKAYRKFYFDPIYILNRLLKIQSFGELMILIIAGLNIFKFSMSGEK